VKKLRNALLGFRSVIEMDLHQDRMLAVTLPASNDYFILRHGPPFITSALNCNAESDKFSIGPFGLWRMLIGGYV